MVSFTPLESTKDLQKEKSVLLRGRGHSKQLKKPVGVVIDRTCRVFISQIPLESIEREGGNALRKEFEAYGPIESYKMFTERSGRFVGNALCTFRNPADAALAVNGMNGRVIDSSTLQVSFSNDHGVVLLHPNHHRGFIPRHAQGDSSQKEPHRGGPNEEAEKGEENSIGATRKEDEKWQHDKYQLLLEGKDMDEVLMIRRHRWGRGGGFGGDRRGSYLSRGERIDQEFEKYIHERDQQFRGEDGKKGYEENLTPSKDTEKTNSTENANETAIQQKDLV